MFRLSKMKNRVKRIVAYALTASMLISGNMVTAFAAQAEASEEIAFEEAAIEEVAEESEEVYAVGEEDTAYASSYTADTVSAGSIQPGDGAVADSAVTVSGNVYVPENQLAAPTNVVATLTKKNQVKITWKKVKGAKTYEVYRMKADGTPETSPLATLKKKNYTDITGPEDTAVETLAYMIVPVGTDGYGTYGKGNAAYVITTPIITKVSRPTKAKDAEGNYIDDPSFDPNAIEFKVDVTTIKGAKQYQLYNAFKKATKAYQTSGSPVSALNASQRGVYSEGRYISSKANNAIYVDTITDNNEIQSSKWYYYKADAQFDVAGVGTIKSGQSAPMRGRITTRAPQTIRASYLSGTSVYLEWEDLENATDNSGNKIIQSTDDYRIMVSKNKGKTWKQLVQIKAGKCDQVIHQSTKYFTLEEAVESGVGKAAGYYPINVVSACYEVENLTPEKEYYFKVCAVKDKVAGEYSDSVYQQTHLGQITDLRVANTNITNATLEWSEVEGATSYEIYATGQLTETQAKGDLSKLAFDRLTTVKPVYKAKDKDADTTAEDEGEICTYTVEGLRNLEYYAFKVVPKYQKTASAYESNRVSTQIRIAAPEVKVKQNGNSLVFTWEKVPKATGYRVEYVTGTNDLNIFDVTKMRTYEDEFSKSKLTFTIAGLSVGEPVTVRVTTLRTTSTETDSKSDAATGNCYKAVEYMCPNAPTINDALYNTENTGADLRLSYGTAAVGTSFVKGYQIWSSSKKSKGYTLLAEFTNADLQYKDTSRLINGTKRYYRVYQIVQGCNESNKTWKAVSRKYAETAFCNPTSVQEATISMSKDASQSYELVIKPSKATMKQVASWYVSDKDTPKKEEFATGVTENKYIKLTTENYSKTCSEYFSPKVKITGKGVKGTTYIKATLANGMSAIIKVNFTDGSASKKEDDEDDGGKSGKGTVIVLDPGHGGSDGGCSSGSLKEKDLNLKISQYTKTYLEDAGFTVYMTRTSDKFVELDERVKFAKNKGAKAIISQHINSGTGKGVECYYSIDGTGKSLASKMCSKTAKATGMSNRGAKSKESETNIGKDYYAIIRNARSTSDGGAIAGLIMENGFIQNDADYLDTDKKLKKIAEANADAIIDYYGN